MKIVSLDTLPEVSTSHSGVGKKKVLVSQNEVTHLQQFGRVTFQPGETVEPHSHSDFSEIMYVEDGEGIMKVDEHEFHISQGVCITVSPNEVHTITVTGTKPLTLLFFGIYN